jgi:hypothetical protein
MSNQKNIDLIKVVDLYIRLDEISYQINEINEHGLGDSDTAMTKYFLIKEKDELLNKLNLK